MRKKSGYIVGGTIIVVALILYMVVHGAVQKKSTQVSSAPAEQQVSQQVSSVVESKVAESSSEPAQSASSTGVLPSTAESSSTDVSSDGKETIMQIDQTGISAVGDYQDKCVISDKKVYYSAEQVLYAYILKTSKGKYLKYFISYDSFTKFGIGDKFSAEVEEFKDANGNLAYSVKTLVPDNG